MARAICLAAGLALGLTLACGAAFAGAAEPDAQPLSGIASFYSEDYTGPVASGPPYDPKKFTAAHRTLPFGTHLRVTDPKTHRSVDVVVNDRGPFVKGRVLDLSLAAATQLHMIERGLVNVTATVQ